MKIRVGHASATLVGLSLGLVAYVVYWPLSDKNVCCICETPAVSLQDVPRYRNKTLKEVHFFEDHDADTFFRHKAAFGLPLGAAVPLFLIAIGYDGKKA